MPTLTPMMSASHVIEKKTAIYVILSWAGSTPISTNPLLRLSWVWAQSGSLPPAIWMWIKLSRSAVIGATPRRYYRSWWMMAWGCCCMLGTLVCFFPHLFFGTAFCVSLSLSERRWSCAAPFMTARLNSAGLSFSFCVQCWTCCMIWRRVSCVNGFRDPPLLAPDRDCSFLCLDIASLEVARKERVITKRVSLRDVAHCNIQNGLRIMQPHRFPLIFGF